MKPIRIVSLLLVLASLLLVCGSFSACSPKGEAASHLRFGEKYMVNEKVYYIFYKNGTGEYHRYSENSYDNTIQSGMVEFEWREASGGVIYLFTTDITYYEDHTSDISIGVTSYPIHVSEDFIAYTYFYTSSGATINRYYRENSKLWKAIKGE